MGNIAQSVCTDLGGNAAMDIADPIWAAVDQAGVALQQRSAGSDAFPCLFRRGNAAYRNESELVADPVVEAT